MRYDDRLGAKGVANLLDQLYMNTPEIRKVLKTVKNQVVYKKCQ